jgi:hypothetical protein
MGAIMHRIYATKKPFWIKAVFWCINQDLCTEPIRGVLNIRNEIS